MREEELKQVRERTNIEDHICGFGFAFAIRDRSISEELQDFLLYGFPKENSLCLLSLVIIVLHVILSDKILNHID